jgi:fluoroquinolone resistance protein
MCLGNEGAALTAPFSCALKSFASFSQFRLGTFKTSEFNGCNLAEADFHGCDLRGALLKSCEFKNADMTGAKLEGVDFRGSRVEGLMALATDFKDAIVDPAQAMVFAELLGLKIR